MVLSQISPKKVERKGFVISSVQKFWLRVHVNIYKEHMLDNEPNGIPLRRVLTHTKEATDKAKQEE